MLRMDWLKRLGRRRAPRATPPQRRRNTRLQLEPLEDRLAPASNIVLTNVHIVNASDKALTPVIGEQYYLEADWTTQGLSNVAQYTVAYTVDGVTLSSPTLTAGAGGTTTQSWFWFLGGWFAGPGTHNISVTVDPGQTVVESSYADNTLTMTFTPQSATTLPQKFIQPLGGAQGQTWGMVNYVDVNPLTGNTPITDFTDYTGGAYTYDGHTGHDMTLANFGAMDAGVPDLAAADGTVTTVQDGNFDRNTAFGGAAANYVIVDNGNGWQTIYYHFRENSILVHVGDHVVAGQVLGYAGSSGFSTAAHLHFEVQHNGDVVEEEYDPGTFWRAGNDPTYQGLASADGVIDAGVSGNHLTVVNDLNNEERPATADVFSKAGGQQFTVWCNGFTVAGDQMAFRFFDPNGTEQTGLDFSFTPPPTRGGYYYYFNSLPANATVGTWTVEIDINGVAKGFTSFQVAATAAGAPRVTDVFGNYLDNGRTTPFNIGSTFKGSPFPPTQTFTVQNVGYAPLNLSNLQLPAGYALVGGLPSAIAPGGSATFKIQLNTKAAGTFTGILSFDTDDPDVPTYRFTITGQITGGTATGGIRGQIYDDVNGDGVEEAGSPGIFSWDANLQRVDNPVTGQVPTGEVGLFGWNVSLIDAGTGATVATQTTGFNGYYEFDNLAAGNYRVVQTPPTAAWTQSTPDQGVIGVGTTVTLAYPIGVGIYQPTHFVLSAPTAVTAGLGFNFTVTGLDNFGNVAAGYTGTVDFSSTDTSASLPTPSTLSFGTGTFSAILNTVGIRTITATDSVNNLISGTSNPISVNPGLAFSPTSLGQGTVNVAYHQTIIAGGGTGNKTVVVSNVMNPVPGIVVPNGGLNELIIAGTPTAAGSETFTVTATDALGATTSANYTITINPPVALSSPTTLPGDTVNVGYTQAITASLGTGAKALAVSNVRNNLGFAFTPGTSSLTITGTPTATGTETFTVTATDAVGATATANYSITVNGPVTINPAALPGATVNTNYNQTITASGGTGMVSFVVSNLQLNGITGLTVPANGVGSLVLTGAPSATGTITFTVTATDQAGGTATADYSITVNPEILVTPSSLPADTVGVNYSQTLQSSGGTGTVTLTVSNVVNAVPGINLPASGTGSLAITGNPTQAGTMTFTVTAADGSGSQSVDNYSITVNPAIALTPTTLPADTVSIGYGQTINASGGTGTLALAVSNIQNPIAGLVVPATGTGSLSITGTPTQTGTETFTVTATDQVGGTTSAPYTITVNPLPGVTPASLPQGTVNTAYHGALTATGGTGSINLAVSNIQNAIPGLIVPATAGGTLAISGKPTQSGTETFTVTATDPLGGTTSTPYSITINGPITISPPSLNGGAAGSSYSQVISASGGTGNISLSVSNIQNPIPGLNIPATSSNPLTVSGTPSVAGTVQFTVTATDQAGGTTSANYSIVIAGPVTIAPPTLPSDTVGVAYNQAISASGGVGTITYTVTNVQNGPGLTLPTGPTGPLTITGSPSSAGTVTFTVTATDQASHSTQTTYAITVNPAVQLSPATLTAGTQGAGYNQKISAAGGTGNLTLAVSNVKNAIAGINLPASGTGSLQITGVPTATGTETFTVTATDQLGATTSASYSITVNPAVTIGPPSLAPGVINTNYSQTIATSGGTGTISLSVTNVQGAIPGLVVPAGGTGTLQITGTPTATGTETFTVQATDQAGGTASIAYSITITPGLALTPLSLPATTADMVLYHQTVSAVGGVGTTTLSFSNVQNPLAGLSLAAKGSVLTITGTPTALGTETFTVTAQDQSGVPISQDYSITVNRPLSITNTLLTPFGTVGVAYQQPITVNGGTGAVAFSIAPTGSLPNGLSIDAHTGIISGMPTAPGVTAFTVLAQDAAGAVASLAFTLTVLPPGFSFDPTSRVLTLTGSSVGYQQSTALVAGTPQTTETFTVDQNVWSFPAAQLGSVVALGTGALNVAVVMTGDTYVGVNGQAAETAEVLTLGEGGGSVARAGAAAFLTFSNFSTVYASAGQADEALIVGTPGVLNTLVGIGGQAYMSSGAAFYYVSGARYVYGYAAGPYDAVYNYDGSGPSIYVVSGTAYSFMLGSDVGGSFFNEGVGFDTNVAITRHGGDLAYVYDSAGDDRLVAYALYAQMTAAAGPGGGPGESDILAAGPTGAYFAHVYAYSFVGGNDLASVDPSAAAEYTVGYYNPTTRLGFHKS